MSNRKQRIYKFAARLLRKTRGLEEFSRTGLEILEAICADSYERMKYACTLNYITSVEAVLLTCVKWTFNRQSGPGLVHQDFGKWKLGRGTNTSPLCQVFIGDGDMIDRERCPLDGMEYVCWLPLSPYMRTVWSGKSKYFVRALLKALKVEARRTLYHKRANAEGKKPRRKGTFPRTRNLFGMPEDDDDAHTN